MKISTRIFFGFAVVIILSGIDSFVNYKLSNTVNRNTEFLTNSESIIRNSTMLHKSIIGMQSGFRGYLLTDNESFLEIFYEGRQEMPGLFIRQRGLLKDPDQIQRLDSIKLLSNSWIKYASSIINAKRDTSKKSSQSYELLFESQLKKEVGKKINDEITLLFKAFDRKEYLRREARRSQLIQSIYQTRITSIILGILTLFAAFIISIFIAHLISKRIASMVEFAEQISKGNFKLRVKDKENDELTSLSHSLNRMSMTLDKNFTELDQFAYVVSHDLKAPLRGLDNIIRWINEDLSEQLSEEMKKYLSLMKGRIQRLENLINGLLEYARIGRVKKGMELVNAQQMISEIVEVIVPKHVKVIVNCNLPGFVTEKIRLDQVFSNLISNAIKYNDKEAAVISISCKELDRFFEFSIKDNGPGIHPKYHEKIFGIFQTLKEKDAFESTGVGLAIVKKILEDVHGSIQLISEPGQGSNFIFKWPKNIT